MAPPRTSSEPAGVVAHLMDGLHAVGPVECRRFFGGWSLRVRGVQFAAVIRDQLYFSAVGEFRAELAAAGGAPFSYAKGGRTIIVEKYYSAPPECLDDADELRRWAAKAIANGGA